MYSMLQESFVKLETLDEEQKKIMFDIYATSYPVKDQWYKTVDDLFRPYKCAIIFTDNEKIVAYFMIIVTKYGNKISLSAVVNDNKIKQLVFNVRARLLVTPGHYQEAAGPVSWILRSRYNLHPIIDINSISKILEDKINAGDKIVINTNWKFTSPGEQVYTRIVTDKKDSSITYENKESIYGIPCSISSDITKNPLIKGFTDYELLVNECGSKCIIKEFNDNITGGSGRISMENDDLYYKQKYRKYKKKYINHKKF